MQRIQRPASAFYIVTMANPDIRPELLVDKYFP